MATNCDMLLHPELMSNEQLITVIQERHLRLPNLQAMHRDELLSIFHQFCVPYGQRKYKDTGRGKILNKNRGSSPETGKHNTINTQKVRNSNEKCKDDDRLKPPPDLLSGHMKRIKLDTNLVKEPDKFKRKIPGDTVSLSMDCTPPKKQRKPITWP